MTIRGRTATPPPLRLRAMVPSPFRGGMTAPDPSSSSVQRLKRKSPLPGPARSGAMLRHLILAAAATALLASPATAHKAQAPSLSARLFLYLAVRLSGLRLRLFVARLLSLRELWLRRLCRLWLRLSGIPLRLPFQLCGIPDVPLFAVPLFARLLFRLSRRTAVAPAPPRRRRRLRGRHADWSADVELLIAGFARPFGASACAQSLTAIACWETGWRSSGSNFVFPAVSRRRSRPRPLKPRDAISGSTPTQRACPL